MIDVVSFVLISSFVLPLLEYFDGYFVLILNLNLRHGTYNLLDLTIIFLVLAVLLHFDYRNEEPMGT